MKFEVRSIRGEVLTYCLVFLIMTGVAVWGTTYAASLNEIPWTWYWVIWASLFSPTVVVTILSAASVDPRPRQLAGAYAGSILLTTAALVAAMVIDVPFYVALVMVAAVCSMIWLLFRTVAPSLPGGPTSLRS
jgi:peptidoglycan/LPS O-acetylase OafA/YrhL